ncbi:MAG: hypothetical protein ACPG6B_09830, partial [Oceanihabitans sp.]
MNPLFSKILVDLAKQRLKAKHTPTPFTENQIIPVVNNIKVELSHATKESFFIIIGVFSAGFGLKGFLLPNHFIDGG